MEAFTSLFQNKSRCKAIMSALAKMLYQEFNRPALKTTQPQVPKRTCGYYY